MEKLLLAVDGSECSARAVRWTIEAIGEMKVPSELHVVTVQPAIASGDVRRFVGSETIERYQREEGDKALAAARALLDEAKVAYTPHILIGQVAQTITDFASQNGCSAIIMGTRGLGGVSGLVLGSVASQVIHLASVPITLIK
jgi:nucleotide-binding universal stress UspA family protein